MTSDNGSNAHKEPVIPIVKDAAEIAIFGDEIVLKGIHDGSSFTADAAYATGKQLIAAARRLRSLSNSE